jgi:CBS-domain-containing membrane protein
VLVSVNGHNAITKAEDMVDVDAGNMYRLVKGTEVDMIVKLADSIEAIKFLSDNGAGAHAKEVLDGLYESLFDQLHVFSAEYTDLPVRDSVRSICKELGIWRAD